MTLLDALDYTSVLVFALTGALAASRSQLDIVGFILSTLVYLVACPLSIGYRKPGLLCIFSVLTTTVLVGVFGVLFYVPLPRGMEIFRELSYMIY